MTTPTLTAPALAIPAPLAGNVDGIMPTIRVFGYVSASGVVTASMSLAVQHYRPDPVTNAPIPIGTPRTLPPIPDIAALASDPVYGALITAIETGLANYLPGAGLTRDLIVTPCVKAGAISAQCAMTSHTIDASGNRTTPDEGTTISIPDLFARMAADATFAGLAGAVLASIPAIVTAKGL